MAAALERRGVHMNFKTVNRRMRSMGLVCTYRRKRRRRSGGGAGHAPNLLGRKFGASAPLEKLVTDVTEMRVLGGRRLYLSSIMDLHNNMVLAHSVSRSNSWEMVGEMLGRLERRWGVPRGVMIHSDRGGLYRCREYLRFAASTGWCGACPAGAAATTTPSSRATSATSRDASGGAHTAQARRPLARGVPQGVREKAEKRQKRGL